jgi:hypothetical protein
MYKGLLVSMFLLFGLFLKAQDFSAGLQLGITGTQVTGDALSGFNKAGFFGGIIVHRPMGRLGEGQLEINFIQKGSRKNAKPSDGIYDSYLLRFNYVEVPVLYKFRIGKYLNIEAGLMLAYLINYKEFDENGQFYPDPDVEDFKKYDFSAFAGLNYRINSKWGISFRYSYSILPLRPKPDYAHYRYDAGMFNEVLCTTFQYSFQ